MPRRHGRGPDRHRRRHRARCTRPARGLDGPAFTQARDAEAGRIESEACGGAADKRCQVVSLYRGGQFKLYTYKKYTDVRLAFAPEDRAATFGGDLDNFSFPRFAIDAAFIRLYENDAPGRDADSTSNGTPHARSRARRCSSPAAPARPSGC